MVKIIGVNGIIPTKEHMAEMATPPYDVIPEGSPLERVLAARPHNLYHVILGHNPKEKLEEMKSLGLLKHIENSIYIVEETWSTGRRIGIIAAAKIAGDKDPLCDRTLLHEQVMESKVRRRVELRQTIGYSFGNILTMTPADINQILEQSIEESEPEYEFIFDLRGTSDMDMIQYRIFEIHDSSDVAAALGKRLAESPLYVADGHHRYTAALLSGQTHYLTHIVEKNNVVILPYNRLVNGSLTFAEVMPKLQQFNLRETNSFGTPEQDNQICIYSGGRAYLLDLPLGEDILSSLGCSQIKEHIYPLIFPEGEPDLSKKKSFSFFPGNRRGLFEMISRVDIGEYNMAIALRAVTPWQVIKIADLNYNNGKVDHPMPAKATCYDPKSLTGPALNNFGNQFP
ncbi:DUF1015 family protein [Candidatus Woesearchaeota archaeon]|nr:DUF1015 family protein [Candidatus Woesearchaeota archaeon]